MNQKTLNLNNVLLSLPYLADVKTLIAINVLTQSGIDKQPVKLSIAQIAKAAKLKPHDVTVAVDALRIRKLITVDQAPNCCARFTLAARIREF